MSDENEWLKNLKKGDEIAIYHYGSFNGYYTFSTVERLSPTQIIVPGGRFKRSDGRAIADRACLVEPTDELKKEIADEKRRNDLLFRLMRETKWRDLPLETLEAVAAALDDRPEPSPGPNAG